jgi:hypothetical protein
MVERQTLATTTGADGLSASRAALVRSWRWSRCLHPIGTSTLLGVAVLLALLALVGCEADPANDAAFDAPSEDGRDELDHAGGPSDFGTTSGKGNGGVDPDFGSSDDGMHTSGEFGQSIDGDEDPDVAASPPPEEPADESDEADRTDESASLEPSDDEPIPTGGAHEVGDGNEAHGADAGPPPDKPPLEGDYGTTNEDAPLEGSDLDPVDPDSAGKAVDGNGTQEVHAAPPPEEPTNESDDSGSIDHLQEARKRCEKLNAQGALADLAFDESHVMTVGESSRVEASLSLETDELSFEVPPGEDGRRKPVLVTCTVQARLLGASDFDISAVGDASPGGWIEHQLSTLTTISWSWFVTPHRVGTSELELQVQPVVQLRSGASATDTSVSEASRATYPIDVRVRDEHLLAQVIRYVTAVTELLTTVEGMLAATLAVLVVGLALRARLFHGRRVEARRPVPTGPTTKGASPSNPPTGDAH